MATQMADTTSIRQARTMSKHTLTITLDAEITDEAALVEAVESDTPEGSLSPDDIREEDRYALRAQFWAEATRRLPREAAQGGGADEGPSSGSEGQDSTPRAASGGGR